MEEVVFLFDVDGVLVKPQGYRESVRAVVNYFSRQMGLGDAAPDDDTVAIFEAQGITCEWDMIPILLAALIDTAAVRLPAGARFDSLQSALDLLAAHPAGETRVDYAPLLRRLGPYSRAGEAPAETILGACLSGEGTALFPRLAGQEILADLFSNTRRLRQSRVTHVFQTFVLGDEVFSRAMGLEAEVKTPSMLLAHDVPLLDSTARDRLLAEQARGRVKLAACTARPSIPAHAYTEPLAVFTPEGEMALKLVGLEGIALVGSGQMGEAAQRMGEHEDRLTKPAPYHALAAIYAAITGDRPGAVEWVQAVFRHYERGAVKPGAALPERITLHVFEDSPSGMRGCLGAAKMLADFGCVAEVRLWGISTHPEKQAALRAVGAEVLPEVNEAIRQAFSLL